MKLSEHFDSKEFDCPCGKCGITGEKMDAHFIGMLENTRQLYGLAMKINSGARCEPYNKIVNGVDGSSHTSFQAADVLCRDSNSRFKLIKSALKVGFQRIGIGKTFIHLDSDTSKPLDVSWLY